MLKEHGNIDAAIPIVSVREVRKHFKEVRAVDGVSLEVRRGEYLALLGPNGAGKTTLVEMVEGLRVPDGGRISILGKSWRHDERHLRSIMGLSLQETNFIDKVTVGETLDLFASFYGVRDDAVSRTLALVRLEEKRKSYCMNLSHGQRQRLALAVALINHPELLILDEPTTGLDPVARREIWDILLDLKKLDTSLILTTHYMEEAAHLCDRIIIMDRGKILVEGTLDELLAAHAANEIISFSLEGGQTPEGLANLDGAIDLQWDDSSRSGRLVVRDIVTSLPPFLAAVGRGGLRLKNLECRRMNLDDLFVSLTGRRLHD